MHSTAFDYHRPASLAEAISLLGSVDGARPLAGGHSLLPLMKQRLATPSALVDLSRIPGLGGITADGSSVRIGALTTHADVAGSAELAASIPVLAETAAMIGDPQVRNRGTIGGAVAHADPAADYPAVLVALDASVVVTGATGERSIAAGDFFVDIFTTALQPGELVTAVQVPLPGDGTGGAYLKHRHPASSYAVVGVAATVTVSAGTCTASSLVVGGVAGSPVSVDTSALVGAAPGDAAYGAVADGVAAAITNPIGDLYASGEFRVHLAGVLARRALAAAAARA